MTLALDRRRRIRAPQARRTMAGDLSRALFELVRQSTALRWPSARYRDDPVGFCGDILGIELWERQREILESVRDHPLTSAKSGHRIGKSTAAAAAALWFYSSFDDARVIMTAPTARQVEGILWRDLRKLHGRAGRCVECKRADPAGLRTPSPCPHSALLDGELGLRPATGLVSENFREVRGYTAKDVEAITGTAGANLLFVMDEASGVADAIYEGLEGNRAGWAEEAGVMVRLLLTGNPTKTSGEFYESHEHPKKKLVYSRITVSSRESPNVAAGRVVIPGLATADWIAQMEAKYGADSAFVKVRVDGEFPLGEDGKAFPIDLITRSQERWEETDAIGPLYVGIDPAGESGMGDEACMSARRGLKQLALHTWLGLTPEAHAVHLLDLIAEFSPHPRERAIVVVDSEGAVGARVYSHLTVIASRPGARFELHRVRASEHAVREPMTFDRIRDELAHSLGIWIREGGAILEDEQLETELHALEWQRWTGGKLKITPKRTLRKILGRSPDRYDATALSTWEPLSASAGTGHGGWREPDDDDEDEGAPGLDPYGGGIDPYGAR